MGMLNAIIGRIDRVVGFEVAYAHCDVPCGIYDPHAAQVAAHTVVRMDMLIADATKNATGAQSAEDRNKFNRYIMVKEELEQLANELKMRLVVTITRSQPGSSPPASSAFASDTGHIDTNMITKYCNDVMERTFYICGPLPFVQAIKTTLFTLNVPNDKVKADVWG